MLTIVQKVLRLKNDLKVIKTIPILLGSKSMTALINDIADNGGGLLIVGIDEKTMDIINQKSFYCEKILANCDTTNIIQSKRVSIGEEIFCIHIDESSEYLQSFTD